jgi:hypothetical protein
LNAAWTRRTQAEALPLREVAVAAEQDLEEAGFYVTNAWVSELAELVFSANDRCNQENLLAQLKGCSRALRAPVNNLLSNGAYIGQ